MTVLETRQRQAAVDQLLDDLRHVVEAEHAGRFPVDAMHEQSEQLRWKLARLVRSTGTRDASG
jgi:hypothetical protein